MLLLGPRRYPLKGGVQPRENQLLPWKEGIERGTPESISQHGFLRQPRAHLHGAGKSGDEVGHVHV